MKKSLLALAALGAFAGAASAQSSVTLYGVIDENLGKDFGSNVNRMAQGASSRLGFRGAEDLGGGTTAIFQIEHRFRPWNGTINGGNGVNGSPVTFWQARSYVGLSGGFGTVKLGREYDGAFFMTEVMFDNWGWDTVVSSMTVTANAGTAVNNFNVNRAVTYITPNLGGFQATAQMAERNDNCGTSGLDSTALAGGNSSGIKGGAVFGNCLDRPYSFGARYEGGPVAVALGYNNPGNVNDKWMTLGATYNFGVAKLWFIGGRGKNTGDKSVSSWQLSATVPLVQGEFRATTVNMTTDGTKTIQGLGLGYFYSLSKRTTLYVDYANNSKLATEKNAYDFGIKHAF